MDAALFLLKFRGRSEKEMADRLARKGFAAETVSEVVARLKELKLLDDTALARSWTESGRRSGWGEQRLRQALWKRGVPRDIIAQVLAEKPEEGAATEAGRARDALAKRVKRLKMEGMDRKTLRRRLESYLARQGFSLDVVRGALETFFSSSFEDNP
jgi:regulatory protein